MLRRLKMYWDLIPTNQPLRKRLGVFWRNFRFELGYKIGGFTSATRTQRRR